MKKRNSILASIVAAILLATGLIFIASCRKAEQGKASVFDDALNYSTVGAVELLKGTSYNTASVGLDGGVKMMSTGTAVGGLTDEEKEVILNNLAVAQGTINGGVVKSEVTASTREGFEFEYTLSAPSITGEYNVYKFYYNSTPKLDDDDDDDDFDDDFDDDDEYEEYISGIVVLDGVEYSVIGEREVEDDEEEVKFLIKLDEGNYVEIENEKETDEEEYSYTLYKNGRKVFETEVEYEVDRRGKTELKFEIEQDGVEMEYSFEFMESKDGKFVKVELEKDDDDELMALIEIIETEGGVEYKFIDKTTAPAPQPTANA